MSETNSQISDAISDQVSVQSSNQSEQMVHKSWRHDVQQLNGELLYFRPSKRHWFGKFQIIDFFFFFNFSIWKKFSNFQRDKFSLKSFGIDYSKFKLIFTTTKNFFLIFCRNF